MVFKQALGDIFISTVLALKISANSMNVFPMFFHVDRNAKHFITFGALNFLHTKMFLAELLEALSLLFCNNVYIRSQVSVKGGANLL